MTAPHQRTAPRPPTPAPAGSGTGTPADSGTVTVAHHQLLAAAREAFTARGVPEARAATAADALCYGDLAGLGSHGLFNLARLYLPLLESGRADPAAEPRTVTDLGACVLLDSERSLGLWSAAQAMDLAAERAGRHGVGLVSVRNATHFGCAGYHTARAARQGMIGVLAGNCGGQRIARPPHGALAMLGTNPLSVAAPALDDDHPFVLDMSTTAVPTGRIRTAARRGEPIPAGWLEDAAGAPVTDPAAFDRGEAYLRWLGGEVETGAYKGYGLGLAVEMLAALLPGAGVGPAPDALDGDGRPHGRDDDIGFLALAVAPGALRAEEDFRAEARSLFSTLTQCPSADGHTRVRYPGWWEAERVRVRRAEGVPLPAHLYAELVGLGLLPRAPRTADGAQGGVR
ncbi:Ldh family oxidoreductase [Streptomyces diacarni]|uniref:Ldh family oxidoreductase n=1 Tax=Streptomyces diacarni TaxID=2800381 RepID=A0A367EUJ2_9ACTN|nr:Ldh family oxidoreductase [Streptomyces diacarni]RCG21342.1 Ldh family oxidoreductase [Streptomyces diacarni]